MFFCYVAEYALVVKVRSTRASFEHTQTLISLNPSVHISIPSPLAMKVNCNSNREGTVDLLPDSSNRAPTFKVSDLDGIPNGFPIHFI